MRGDEGREDSAQDRPDCQLPNSARSRKFITPTHELRCGLTNASGAIAGLFSSNARPATGCRSSGHNQQPSRHDMSVNSNTQKKLRTTEIRFRLRSLLIGLTTVVLLTFSGGCTSCREWWHHDAKVGPNYCRPVVPAAPHWIDADDQRLQKDSEDHYAWWTSFQDPVLNGLVHEARDQNLSLRVAGWRIFESRSQWAIVRGNLLPQQQQAFGDYTRSLKSTKVATPLLSNRSISQWDAGFNLAWELDFWGRFRRAMESADATLDASIENYDDVLVTLLADVATSYIEIRTLQKRLKLAEDNVKSLKGSYDIAAARFKNGLGTDIDVQQAQTNLSETEALIPQLRTLSRAGNNRLCVLLGRVPEDLTPSWKEQPFPKPPASVAVGIPADLMRRRPDVRKVERDLAAQSALIGVAESELYPHIAINGTIGVEAANFKDLFTTGADYGSIGPSIRWNILNYGRIVNAVHVQDAKFQELAYTYQQTMLKANEEAEDGITGYLNGQLRLASLNKGVNAAQKANDLVVELYRQGKADFNRVFNIQSFLVKQQDASAQAEGDVSLSLVGLYRALGGGWQIRLEQGGSGNWCEGCCPLPACCPDDYCPKPCPTCPTGSRPEQTTCGPQTGCDSVGCAKTNSQQR